MNDMWGNTINSMNNNSGFAGNTFPRFNNGYNMLPKYELIKVSGEESARNFRMAPNSDALLLDDRQPILYHVQTDGAGYVTVMAYDLVPHQTVAPVDINQLNQRVAQLEEIINARQSNSQSSKSKKQRVSTNDSSVDVTTANISN